MPNDQMQSLLSDHIQRGKEQRTQASKQTAELAGLNARLIFTNASQRSPDVVKEYIGGMIDGVFGRNDGSAEQSGLGGGGIMADSGSPGVEAGS